MRERPILMQGWGVRAILDDRKTHTRRVIKPQPSKNCDKAIYDPAAGWLFRYGNILECPYGNPGDLLWVRETWADKIIGCLDGITYRADHIDPAGDGPINPIKWKPSIHLLKKYARLWLRITDIRVERVQDISEDDCWLEGIDKEKAAKLPYINSYGVGCATAVFGSLWDSINAKRGYSWESNPWVWIVVFERVVK